MTEHPPTATDVAAETTTIDPAAARQARINGAALLLAPLPVVAIMLALVGPPEWRPILLGAAGWFIALVLRQPVALVSLKLFGQEKTGTIVGWFSGPAEELVRLALVLLVLDSVGDALWAGFGWATIEVVLVAINVFAIAALLTKDDPKSAEARELLASQGMTTPHHPATGLIERLSATALHLGFTLLLFANPWFVLLTLPLHSLTNMVAVRFVRNHVVAVEVGLAITGAAALAGGLLATIA
ncbi:hypothetical protein OH146_07885 [Salinibacterium sp. SYSU T00001]|uniref:hypothetical protein n=1 Tax=Homoserinimonas sedimenticola TaxID=2986805 RepID=UPI002235D6BA|nr:hypothetical protein [Salinibacterium sedimenticola]MCW4385693.1 hypothetical protein [Salinibacterium sedimenticola]